jgi:cytochrome d ubiquinol oxidase subunit I
VYGLMRTADSVPPSLTGEQVLISLICYIAVYLVVYPAGIMVMARMVRRGPDTIEADSPIESGRPERPTRVQLQPDAGQL